jgi:hypothetical protein
VIAKKLDASGGLELEIFFETGYLTPEYSKKPFTQSWLLIGESLFFYGEGQKLFFGTNPGESARQDPTPTVSDNLRAKVETTLSP